MGIHSRTESKTFMLIFKSLALASFETVVILELWVLWMWLLVFGHCVVGLKCKAPGHCSAGCS